MNKGILRKPVICLLVLGLLVSILSVRTETVRAAQTGPQVPFGQDIQDYDPAADGYYGYLPVAYLAESEGGSGTEEEMKDAFLPVIIWNNSLYASFRDFGTVSGISVSVKNGKACMQILDRRLYMTEGSSQAVYTLGSRNDPYICQTCSMHAAPFVSENEFWFPLNEAMLILGINGEYREREGRSGSCLCFGQTERGVCDILADLYDPAEREERMHGYAEQVCSEIVPESTVKEFSLLNGLLYADLDYAVSAAIRRMEAAEPDSSLKNLTKEQRNRIIAQERTKSETEAELSAALNRYGFETKEELRSCMHAAYLFLQSCYESDRLFLELRNEAGSGSRKEISDELPELASDLELLSQSDTIADEELPRNNPERADALAKQTDNAAVAGVTALYVTAKGEVRDGVDDSAVEDAQCRIYAGETVVGSFSGTPGGSYRVHIPFAKPEGLIGTSPDPGLVSLEFRFSSPTTEGEDSVHHLFPAGTEEEIKTVILGSFDWYQYIRETLSAEKGFADLQEKQMTVSSSNAREKAGWSSREGIAGADVWDMTSDGQDDLIVYSFGAPEEDGAAGYTLYADFYTEEKGAVTHHASLPLCFFDGIGYQSCRAGIIKVSDIPYLWVECNGNSYFGDGTEFTASFYGWDGSQFRKIWLNGKTDGGSSNTTYSFCTYSEDGSCDKIDLYVDSSYWFYVKESDTAKLESPAEALETGYSYLGLPQPKTAVYENSNWTVYSGWFHDEEFPTYWDTATVMKSVEVCTGGSRSGWNRQMTDSAKDYTALAGHIAE